MKSPRILLCILSVIVYAFVVPGTANAQTGPVAYYPLGDTGTTVIDSSGYGNNGTASGVLPAANRFGIQNAADSFNGVNSRITVNDSPSLRLATITISAWVKPASLGTDRKIVGKNYNSSSSDSYNLGIYSNNKIEFWIRSNGGVNYGVRSVSGGTAVDTGIWYHVVGVYDGNAVTTYLNGHIDRRSVVGAVTIPYNASPLLIGQTPTAGYLKGLIDDIRIYDRALCDAEILALYTMNGWHIPVLIPDTSNPTYNRRPQLHWYADDSIPVFRIQIDTSRQFTSPIISETLSDTFFSPATDLPFDTIYWRVGNEADTSGWSAISSVRIVRATPTLISYTPNPTYIRRPRLRWRLHIGISTYKIQIDTTQQFSLPIVSTTTTDTFYMPADNLPFDTIYWRVRNDVDTLSWSTVSSVRIVRATPVLIACTPNPTYNQRPQFLWHRHDSIPVFRIQIDTNQQFSSPIVSTTTTDTFYTPVDDLPFDTIYWRIENEADTLAWSTVSSVRIVRVTPVLIPYTPNPTYNRRPQLRWHRNDSIPIYRVNIDTVPQFTSPIVSQTVTDTFFTPTADLPYGTIYWRVGNDADPLAWSTVSSIAIMITYPPGIVAYWSFDSSSGSTYYDVTGHGYNAIATGTGLGLSPGVKGEALSCPGGGYEISAANSSNDFYLSKFSIECWFYSNISPAQFSADAKIFNYQYLQSGVNGYTLSINPQGYVIFSAGIGWAWENTRSSNTIGARTWYHLACTYDSAYLRVYINGVLSNSIINKGMYVKPPNDVRIGCAKTTDSSNAVQHVNGLIDELKLYNYALPEDSIAAHCKSESPVPVLIAYTPNPTYNRRPQLRWYAHNLIPIFRIQLADNQQFSLPIISAAVTDTFYVPATDLPLGTTYWRVGNDADTSRWSAVFSLTIGDSSPLSNGRFVAVGGGGTVLASSDGFAWTSQTSGTISGLNSVTYGNGLCVAVGGKGTVLTSLNGLTWTPPILVTTAVLNSVTYGKNQFVLAGDGPAAIFTSPDGATWTNTNWLVMGWLNSVVYGDSQYVGVGQSAVSLFIHCPDCLMSWNGWIGEICSSSDGIAWTGRFGYSRSYCGCCFCTIQPVFYSATYGNGQYIAVGNSGTMCTSADGINWTNRTSGTSSLLHSITYGNKSYIAVGDSGTIIISPDGIAWTNHTSGTNSALNSVIYGNDRYIAVGGNGTIITSPDGINWTPSSAGTTNNLTSVTWLDLSTNSVKPTQKNLSFNSSFRVRACNSLLIISLPSAMLGKTVDLAVYSVSGRKIMAHNVRNAAGRFTLPVPNLALGTYILVVNDGSRKAIARFVAMR